MNVAVQPEFGFSTDLNGAELIRWHQQRRAALQELARAMGLPEGRDVESWVRQEEINFSSDRDGGGLTRWHQQRHLALQQLARAMGLPLGRKVEVWLRGEIRLIGRLELREHQLFFSEDQKTALELIVDNVPFSPNELVSCVAVE